MLKIFTLVFLFISLSFATSCKDDKKTIKQAEVSFTKEGELTLYKSTSDSIIATLDIEIADTEFETQRGLMYRSFMPKNQGMLFIFPQVRERSFYMKNTKIALDIIYLDEAKKIVSFQENAIPFNEASLPSNLPAKYVLEINAGLANKWLLEVGDTMQFTKTAN